MSIMQEYPHKRLEKVIVRVVPLRNYVNYYYYLIVKEDHLKLVINQPQYFFSSQRSLIRALPKPEQYLILEFFSALVPLFPEGHLSLHCRSTSIINSGVPLHPSVPLILKRDM